MSKPQITHNSILEIAPYVPGKSRIQGHSNPIKLSSNENPFGPSPKALEAIESALPKLHRYPDGNSTALREALAEQYSIPAAQIVCGAGSDELITLLCDAYAGEDTEVIYTEHGFLMYPIAALKTGATPVVAKEKFLKASVEHILEAVTERTRIVFIANPNNPTGSYLNAEELQVLHAGLPDHVLLVIDDAYAEYADADDYDDGLALVTGYDNVVVTRTFSKIYGLGGLRLGWAYCPPEIADVLNRIRPPFNVSSLAQLAGIAALQDMEFLKRSKAHNSEWRSRMHDSMEQLGLRVYPSIANFLLVKFPDEPGKTAEDANTFLLEKGLIGRMVSAYQLPDCMRFTIGRSEENEKLIKALTDFLG